MKGNSSKTAAAVGKTSSGKKNLYPYMLLAPALIIMVCVVFIPVLRALYQSFLNYDLRYPNRIAFVGLANYI